MSVTKVSGPADYGRVWDSNRLNYEFSSNNWQEPNFSFYIEAKVYDIESSAWEDIGTFYMYPLTDGTMNFNPSVIYRNYLTSDIDITTTSMEEATNSATQFRLDVYEYFSDATNNGWPYKQTAGASLNNDITLFNGSQAAVAYDDTTVGPGNTQWVMSGASSGVFLTDAGQFRLDSDERAFAYYLADPDSRPTRARFTVWYWGGGAMPDGMVTQYPSSEMTYQSTPNPSNNYTLTQGLPGTQITPAPSTTDSKVISGATYLNISYTYSGTIMSYIPIGPKNLTEMSKWPSGAINTWLYYKIDLLDVDTVLNKEPIWVNRKSKCDKYGLWRMFWLNPHGGYDTFTFTQKNTLVDKIERTTFKQRLLPTQTTSAFQAGERVFNTKLVEETTLRSFNVSQQESQLIIQMARSPIVYAMMTYDNDGSISTFLAPYIVTSTDVQYQQKINDKEITYEITLRPANEVVIQQG